MVVENVRGAQKWVGPAKWSFGSYMLWGDVPAVMPFSMRTIKGNGGSWVHENKGHALRGTSSGSKERKAATALAAKIPFPLASWIAKVYKP
jgi:hypothetical protein